MGDDEPSEKVQLMNEDQTKKTSSSPARLNRKSLVIFFGVTVLAAAIVICTVMATLYSGKKCLFQLLSSG